MKFLDYIQGVRKGKDAQRIEREAMNDPFLSGAIDGYDSIEGNHADRIARMQARVLARTSTTHNTRSGAWKVAVAAVAVIALLSGYFALLNHESSMALAVETENSYINLYAPEVYIEQKRLELTAMIEDDPSQEVSVESVVPISNLDEVIKPVEVLQLYVPGVYADLKKQELNESSLSKEDSKKIFIADASSSILAEAKVSVKPDRLRDAWTAREETEVRRSRTVSINDNVPQERRERLRALAVVDEKPQKTTTVKETKATSKVVVADANEARLLATEAGFDEVEAVTAEELNGDALQLNEVVTTTKKSTKESYYRPRLGTGTSRSFTGASSSVKRVKPEPLIGKKEYKKYLKDNIIRPQDDDCNTVKGKVVVQISVDKEGNPTTLVVKKALCPSLDKEAVRLIKVGPKWTYGTLRVDVEVQF